MFKPPITSVSDHSDEHIVCEAVINDDYPNLNRQRIVPIWFGLEFITDSIALHGELCSNDSGSFVGASKVDYMANSFSDGQELQIEIELRQEKDGVRLYKGKVVDKMTEEPLVESLIKTYVG